MADHPNSRSMPGTASPCASKHCRSARFQSVGLHNWKPRKTLRYVRRSRSFFVSTRTLQQNSLEDSLRGSESPRGACKTQQKGLYGLLVASYRLPPKPARTTSTQTGHAKLTDYHPTLGPFHPNRNRYAHRQSSSTSHTHTHTHSTNMT